MKNKHFLGRRIEGKMCYYSHMFTDSEFEALIDRIGGALPHGWVAWHFEYNENVKNSVRVQTLIKRVPSVIGLYGAEPSKRWIEIELMDDLEKQAREMV